MSILLLGMILLLQPTSCVPCENGYKQFRNERGLALFTLEYPCDWRVASREIDREFYGRRYTAITIASPGIENEGGNKLSSGVNINAVTPDDDTPDAKSWLLHSLGHAEGFPDFTLVDQSSFTLDGWEGEQIIYLYRTTPDEPYYSGGDLIVVRDIYLEHEGLLWNIHLSSHEEIIDKHEIYLDHILDSFQFLD
jgi:hypothetical protein